jgi:choline dehydrogenase
VLASGAFNSPQLLQLSGIGNAAELGALGIPVVADLPGVGEHLQDHMVAKLQHSCTQPVTIDAIRDRWRWPLYGLQWLFTHRRARRHEHLRGGWLVRTTPRSPTRTCCSGSRRSRCASTRTTPRPGLPAHDGEHAPAARGTVKIASTDPRRQPALKFNYLGNDVDRRFGSTRCTSPATCSTSPLQGAGRRRDLAGPGVETDEEILDWVARTAQSNMHPTSTCRLGTDELSVVDPLTMGVHGVEGLAVARRLVMRSARTAPPTRPR